MPGGQSGFSGGRISATPLQVNGVLYFTMPDHVWAVDARTGREVWHYTWTSNGGVHIGNRGVGVYGNWLYFETPDCNLVSLNLKDGKERWRKTICDLDQYYFGSMAPLVVKNHIITGVSGDDLDRPGYIESHDPGDRRPAMALVHRAAEDGRSRIRRPGRAKRPMKHGGGMTWLTPTYDPELNLIYVPTGNPQPVIAGKARPGANLFTASMVALNPDTGKMEWYFQSSPHDTHDWDATQTPVLFDGEINGQKRKLVAQASRNGYFFVLDRATGKNISSTEYVKTNWSKGVDAKGSPIPRSGERAAARRRAGLAESGRRHQLAASDLQSRHRPVLRQRVARLQRLLHLRPERQARRLGRQRSRRLGRNHDPGDRLQDRQGEVDPQVGRRRPLRPAVHRRAICSSRATGPATWWRSTPPTAIRCGTRISAARVTNGPITYELDGTQYLVVAAGDTLFGFAMLR